MKKSFCYKILGIPKTHSDVVHYLTDGFSRGLIYGKVNITSRPVSDPGEGFNLFTHYSFEGPKNTETTGLVINERHKMPNFDRGVVDRVIKKKLNGIVGKLKEKRMKVEVQIH
jgi:hypothetical protein